MIATAAAHGLASRTTAERFETPLDVLAVRADFPVLSQRPYGKRLAYLDNASSTQKPYRMIEAIERFYSRDYANVHRGVYQLSEKASAQYAQARERTRLFLGARDAREVVFTSGTTEAINLVAQCVLRRFLQRGDEILVTEMEHHSNIVPWQLVCEATGAKLCVARINGRGELDLESVRRELTSRTRLIAVTHVSNVLGAINPIQQIAKMAHERGVLVLVDGAQAVARIPLDMQDLDCDFYAFSGHKVYGPMGIGVLYGKREILEDSLPTKGAET